MGVRSEVGFIPPLDGLRGVAILWVMLFHFTALRDAAGDPWVEALRQVPLLNAVIRNGYLGVDLFFLISGFLLTLPWFLHARAGQAAPSARKFYARRVRRIVPAYYLQLAVLFLVVLPLLLGGLGYWKRDMYVIIANVFAHAAFLHNTSPLTSASMSVNGALWTLAVEAQYYLLLPLLAPLFVRRPVATTLAAFALAALWQYAARHGFDAAVAWQMALGAHWGWPESNVRQMLLTQLPDYLGHFALGTLLGRAWLAWRERAAGGHASSVLLVGAAVVALAALLAYLGSGVAVWGDYTWILSTLCLGTLLFAAVAGRGPFVEALLARGPLAFLGRISYSAYLYHLLVLVVLLKYADALPPLLAFPVFAAATVALAWLSWRFVELRFIGVRDQLPENPVSDTIHPVS
jgi:peptidoglycan/LPS O-acetylase OafA/YrhL